ncbi:MAG: CocE/NonD family hydrolase [Pseudomonadota bacterium]
MNVPPDILTIEHLWIPMPDGIRLAARLWMPARIPSEGVPAILEYIPYRKGDMVRARDERNHPYLARNGFVSLRVDMRGSGDSEGVMPDMYAPDELADARHVIDWIAAQDWCNGCVGMFGTSWGGTAGLQASIDPPKALKAVIAVCATHDRYEDDIHHKGGCLITDTFEWGATLPAILALPPTPESGEDWRDRWAERLEHLPFPVETWVREEARGSYWRHGSIKHQADRIGCPILSVGGWSDRYSNSVMSLVDARPDRVWGIVGPWGHHYPDHGHPGPAIGFQQVAVDWWNHWLRDDEPADLDWPRLRVWLREFDTPQDSIDMRNGAWIQSGPASDETADRPLWLSAGNLLSEVRDATPTGWSVPHDLRHGLASGDTGYFGRFGGLPLDQNEDDDRALCFETQPLKDDLVIYGSVAVELSLSVEVEAGQICLRLNDVSPEGVSARVGLSILNLALDDTLDSPTEPHGTGVRTVRLRFHTTAYRFKADHCLRLSIAPSYWPTVWTPSALGSIRIDAGRVVLPVLTVDPAPLETTFPPPLDLPERKSFESIASPRLNRARVADPDSRIAVTWHQPLSATRYTDIETTYSFETWSDHRIHPDDPNTASSLFVHRMILERLDGKAEVMARLQATCTADSYVLHGHVEVNWEGKRIADRRWHRTIERHLS